VHYVDFTPVGVILEFAEPQTVSAFRAASAQEWIVEKADSQRDLQTRSGSYELLIARGDLITDPGPVTVPLPRDVSAKVFKVTFIRTDFDGIAHIYELDPVFAESAARGSLQGTISADEPGGRPLPGARVTVCAGSACRVTATDARGGYRVDGLLPGLYVVTAFPPAGEPLFPATGAPRTLTPGTALRDVDLVLHGPELPPAGATIAPAGATETGVPTVFFGAPFELGAPGCPAPGGSARYSIRAGGVEVSSGAMTSSGGRFVAQVPALAPAHGDARVEMFVTCADGPRPIAFDLYIDPSGSVRTPAGAPIPGVTVMVLRADLEGAPFAAVPDGSPVLSPRNRSNPTTTGPDGAFSWDVVPGVYKVRAQKAGCRDPRDPTRDFVESAELSIPPAALDLDLRLACPTTHVASLHVQPACSPDPRVHRRWRVRNRNPFPVAFTWRVLHSRDGLQGAGIAAAALDGVPTDTYFTTPRERGRKTIGVYVNGALDDTATGRRGPCPRADAIDDDD
jgi:hypothetical protein